MKHVKHIRHYSAQIITMRIGIINELIIAMCIGIINELIIPMCISLINAHSTHAHTRIDRHDCSSSTSLYGSYRTIAAAFSMTGKVGTYYASPSVDRHIYHGSFICVPFCARTWSIISSVVQQCNLPKLLSWRWLQIEEVAGSEENRCLVNHF